LTDPRASKPRRGPPNARTIAARVLGRVERDGAYAAASLDTEIERHPQLDPRDRALATEIVYGVLRTRRVLEERLARFTPRGLPDDTAVREELLVAAYQICFLDRVPTHAAVDAAVSAVHASRNQRMAGFANAILRKLAAAPDKPRRDNAIVESAAPWLRAALENAVGLAETHALLGAGLEPHGEAHASVRVARGHELPEWLAAAPPGRASPLARLPPRSGDLRRREGYADGAFTLQEEGAQVVGLALGARSGDRVLDACAGRGQKTTLLREQVGPDADVWAVDLYPEKLARQAPEFERLRLRPAQVSAVDWTVGTGAVPDGFDRVLVDAPCTGTGTLRRRPEIGIRLQPGDPARIAGTATAILRSAATRAKLGGRVVFAVCSALVDEAEHVVESVRDVLEPLPFDAPELLPLVEPGATTLRLLPIRHGTDGFFVASFRRVS
jgi:16S rRNA (cytosine967-C5)-methyltransferase